MLSISSPSCVIQGSGWSAPRLQERHDAHAGLSGVCGAVCCAGWKTTVSAYGACLGPDSVLPKPDVPGLQTASASYGLAS